MNGERVRSKKHLLISQYIKFILDHYDFYFQNAKI